MQVRKTTHGLDGQHQDTDRCKEQCQVHAGEEDHARPGWTTSRHGQDCPWKSQSEWQTTEINGESTSMVWLTLGLRTAREPNRTAYYMVPWAPVGIWAPLNTWFVGPHESTQWQHVNRCSHLTQLMLVTDVLVTFWCHGV